VRLRVKRRWDLKTMALTGEAKTGLVLTDAMRLDWLRLIRSENVGPRTFKTLINHYGGAGAALEALPGLVRSKQGRDIRLCSQADAEREWDQATRMGIRFVAVGEVDYPVPLRNIADPPPLLSVRGDVSMLSRHCIAIVGSRNASIAGLKMTERLATGLGQAGIIVVSGLARGIDVAAHKASLKSGTIAVLAGGHARLYPADHAPLLDQILAEGGTVLSEMPLTWEPRARDFPRRNRLVSGLSLGVVVVEAAKRSGSLITARFAGEQGRELFAVPHGPARRRDQRPDPRWRDLDRLRRSYPERYSAHDREEPSLALVRAGAGRG
jgi:DNA processing protein